MTQQIEVTRETPSFEEFDPRIIPWQWDAVKKIANFDYSLGVHEVLLSGSYGSAKSLLMAHEIIKHVAKWEKSRCCIGRLSMPDLKETLVSTLLDHIFGSFQEGVDYEFKQAIAKFEFYNGSEIISRSWADKKFTKFRSLKLSMGAIEELTENDGDMWSAYEAMLGRIGRLPHVKSNLMMSATNPDAPSHPAYKRFMLSKSERRHVFYSLTEDNPFLPKWYVENLKQDLDPKMAQRLLYGKWRDIAHESVYYNYDTKRNFINTRYNFDIRHPIDIMFDFNIGKGKPMSAAVGQHIKGAFHVAKEFVMDGSRTGNILEAMDMAKIFSYRTHYRVFGDASGNDRDTRSFNTDYTLIESFLRRHPQDLSYEICVPRRNPAIRKRHNFVNGVFLNDLGRVRCYIYKEAPTADEGFRLTRLRPTGQYEEEDRDHFQHITTAIGYWITYELENEDVREIFTYER